MRAVRRSDLPGIFRALLLTGLMVAAWPGEHARAQQSGDVRLDSALARAGLEERLGETIPGDVTFYDEDGRPVELGRYFDGETPVLLTMVYHNCPMLCNLVLDGLNEAFRQMEWVPGQEFEVVTVSFAADETPDLAARQKAKYIEALGKPQAAEGWHFLTGDAASIQTLADAVGFQYNWVEEQQTYAHPATLMFLSGEGKLTRYLHGLEYAPREVRTALVEASAGTVGTVLDQAFLYCFQYDPTVNSYVPHAANLMKVGGVLTVVVLGIMLFIFWRRERHRRDEQWAAVS